jgi:voltage-gated potassium channel
MRREILHALQPSSRLRVAAGLLVGVIGAGTVGYMVLAGMSFVDALYQTVTTLSTVGFRELTPFSTGTKLFTIFLILTGVGTALYTLTLVVQELLEADIRTRFYRRRMEMTIEG